MNHVPAEKREATELWLIRHGESTGNRDGILQGQADLPLSPLGHTQVLALAARLRGQHFGALYASDLQRAQDTAAAVAAAVKLSLRTDANLREIDPGAWSGLTTAQIRVRFPAEWLAWQQRDVVMKRGGGESYVAAAERFRAACDRIAEAHPGERILVVAHGAVIRLYLTLAMGIDLDRTWHLMISNTSITKVRPFAVAFDGDRPLAGRVVVVNDHAHLEALQTASGDA